MRSGLPSRSLPCSGTRPRSRNSASLTAAQVNVSAVAGLQSCNFTSVDTVPPCLLARINMLAAANDTDASVTASDGNAGAGGGGASWHNDLYGMHPTHDDA